MVDKPEYQGPSGACLPGLGCFVVAIVIGVVVLWRIISG